MMVFKSLDILSQLLQSALGLRFAVRMVKDMHQLPDNIAEAVHKSVVSLNLRDGMAWSINQPITYPLTSTTTTEMTVRVRTTAELLGYRASTIVLNILADMQHLFPDSDFVHHVN